MSKQITTVNQASDPLTTRLIIAADRRIYRFASRWLTAVNTLFAAFVTLIVLAPIAKTAGWTVISRPIYAVFGVFCHQQPDRSFHIDGNPLACCERCAAVYLSLAMSGVLFALVRDRVRRPRLPEFMLLASPLVIDGLAVGAGIYDGNPLIRIITGAAFGFAMVWTIFPRLDDGFANIRLRLETLFARLVTQGRAQPLT